MAKKVLPYKDIKISKKEQVAMMFDRIARHYDFLNHFLSLGIDRLWRKKAIRLLQKDNPKQILDVATGTGDFAIEAIKLKPEKVTGVDISEEMLEYGQKKINKKKLRDKIELQVADSENLPFNSNIFDACTVGFGVRNFANIEKGIGEMYRVLKPGGKLVVLEFSKPKKFPLKQLYGLYFHKVLPFIGRIISKDNRAYTYLPESVEQFPDGKEFLQLLQKSKFQNTEQYPLTFGICSIYTGIK